MIGIYAIENTVTGKVYVGQSIRVKYRWKEHKMNLRLNKHDNPYLQRSYNKHGVKSFKYYILETCRQINLNEKEVHWINRFIDKEGVYNITIPDPDTGHMVNSCAYKCYLLDLNTHESFTFASMNRLKAYINAPPSHPIQPDVTVLRDKYVMSLSPWTKDHIESYLEQFRRYLYNKGGRLVDIYENEKELKDSLGLKSVWYGVDHINYLGHRISLNYLGDTIPAYKENRGGENTKDFEVYDVFLNLLYEGNNMKAYCEENGYKYNRVIDAIRGKYYSFPGKGKKIKQKKRWYKGLYWTTPDVPIKDWVDIYEKDNHRARLKAAKR